MRISEVGLKMRKLFLVALFAIYGGTPGSAAVIDTMDTTSGWSPIADGAATASLSSVAGAVNNALRVTYDLTAGNFIEISKTVSTIDSTVLNANGVRFLYRATGNANTVEVKLTDADNSDPAKSDKLDLKFLAQANSQWITEVRAFPEFALVADGNGSFDFTKLARLTLGVTRDVPATGGSGSLAFETIELVTANTAVMADFDTLGDPVRFRGNTGAFTGTTGTATRTYVSNITNHGSAGAMQLTYAVNSDFAGLFILTGSTTNANVSWASHLSFAIRGAAGGEKLNVKLADATTGKELAINTYLSGGITTTFQTVLVPLADFTSVDMAHLKEFDLVASNTIGSGSGTIYLDDVQFIKQGGTTSSVRVLDDFNTDLPLTNWAGAFHPKATLDLTMPVDASPPGATASNRVLRLDYSFVSSADVPYAVAERDLRPNLAAEDAMQFQFRGSGANNTLEVKIVDENGTVYRRNLANITNTNGDWKTAILPMRDFLLFTAGSGSNTTLNLKRFKILRFAISRGDGGAGTLDLDEVQAVTSPSVSVTHSGRLISQLQVPDNPFSPNGQGIKEIARFLFTLRESARTRLTIYDLRGHPLRVIESGDQPAGSGVMIWDGRDTENRVVANGLYFFRFEATTSGGDDDAIKQVIGVIR